MPNKVIFILDNDKVFLELYTKLLQSKGWQVFATDNLFLLLKYAQTALPEWIFIDESFADNHEKEIIQILNKGIPFKHPNYAIMSEHLTSQNFPDRYNMEIIYKPHILEKIMQISKNCCNPN